MYSRKSVKSRMECWGTSFLGQIPIHNHLRLAITEKRQMPNSWSKIPWELSLRRRAAYQTLSKIWDISSAAAWLASDQLKVIAILSDTQDL